MSLKFYFSMTALFALFAIGVGSGMFADNGIYNMYAHQADAFLQGRLYLTERLHDVAKYQGRYYVPFPPFPTIVLLPSVALFGLAHTKATLIATLLTLINFYTFSRLLKRLDVADGLLPWLVAALFMGTGYWLTVVWSHEVWFFAHVVAVTCMLLSLNESMASGRGAVAGLFLGLAILSRQMSFYSAIFLAVALWTNANHSERRDKLIQLGLFALTASLCVAMYLVFNHLRFDNAFKTGYAYLGVTGFLKERLHTYGLFNPIYLIHNLTYMFVQGPHFIFDGDILPRKMDPFGTSLTFASPFLLTAFWSNLKKPLRVAAWSTIALALLHMSMYYANGWAQINTQRYALDFIPLLMLLVASSVHRIDKRLFKGLIVYSIALNFVALVVLTSPTYQTWVDAASITERAADRSAPP